MAGDPDITLVTLQFDAADPERLLGVLAKYVVLTRMEQGCVNVDLAASVTVPGRLVVLEKWDSPQAQQAHFDGPAMVDMAEGCRGILRSAPQIDLLESISAHDRR